jgi:hypothetical protein
MRYVKIVGYLTGYDGTFSHHTNESEIWLQANSGGAMNGNGQDSPAPAKIVCTVSPFFCKAFMHGYILAYTQELRHRNLSHFRKGWLQIFVDY